MEEFCNGDQQMDRQKEQIAHAWNGITPSAVCKAAGLPRQSEWFPAGGSMDVYDRVWLLDPCRGSVRKRMRPSEALNLHREALRQLFRSYGFARPRVFGSVLTRTDTEDSDLDLLVEPQTGTTLFTLAGLEQDAQELTGVRVSVLTPGFLSPKFRDRVMRQAEPL